MLESSTELKLKQHPLAINKLYLQLNDILRNENDQLYGYIYFKSEWWQFNLDQLALLPHKSLKKRVAEFVFRIEQNLF